MTPTQFSFVRKYPMMIQENLQALSGFDVFVCEKVYLREEH